MEQLSGRRHIYTWSKKNEDEFLGQTFDLHDAIYSKDKACVRYTAKQGKDFSLEVSGWYYANGNLIQEIVAYYHIGEIRGRKRA